MLKCFSPGCQKWCEVALFFPPAPLPFHPIMHSSLCFWRNKQALWLVCRFFSSFFFLSAPFTNFFKDPHSRQTAETPAIKWFYSFVTREDHFSTPALTNCVTTTSRLFVLPALFVAFGSAFVTKHNTTVRFFISSPACDFSFFFPLCLFNTVTDCVALVSIKFRHCVFEKKERDSEIFCS